MIPFVAGRGAEEALPEVGPDMAMTLECGGLTSRQDHGRILMGIERLYKLSMRGGPVSHER